MSTSIQSFTSESIEVRSDCLKLFVLDTDLLYVEGLSKILADTRDFSVEVLLLEWNIFQHRIEEEEHWEEIDILLIRADQSPEIVSRLLKIRQANQKIKILVHVKVMDDFLFTQLLKVGINGTITANSTVAELKQALYSIHEHGQYFNRKLSDIWQPEALSKRCNSEITKREIEILRLIYDEFTNDEIGELLFISKRTVDGHRQNLMEKTGAKNTVGLIKYALKNKIVKPLLD